MKSNTKIFTMPFAAVYPLYIKKVERKGKTKEDVDTVIMWLTGYSLFELKKQVDKRVSFEEFFNQAPHINPNVGLITGSICGIKIQDIADPLMKDIRYMDKLVDEVASGRAMKKILREG